MRKINSLFNANSELDALAERLQSHQTLAALWQNAAPKQLAESSKAIKLINGQLVILADSAIIANKIKLTQASLLMQIDNLQQNVRQFSACKVTAIAVKVQVNARAKPIAKPPRMLSANAATHLKDLAQHLGDSPLATKLKSLANKH